MTISGESIALTATTSATLSVATQHLPMWVLVAIWLLWWALAIVNTEKVTVKKAITILITGSMFSAIVTNIIVDKVFGDTIYGIQISMGIALILGLFWHLFFARFWAKREKVVDIAENITTDKIKSITKSKND